MDSKSTCQDWFETLKQTSFTTKQRKKVFQALNLLGKESSEDAEEEEYDERGPPPRPKKKEEAERRPGGVVSEVYSPPRVASMAGRSKGLQQGSSFDLLNGWNLEDPEDVKEMWRVLRQEDPMLIVLCPPCAAFSRLQEWNFRKLSLERSINILKLGLYHLDLVREIAEWQVQRGGWIVFEQPEGARSWDEEAVRRIAALPGVQKVTCDMCMFGMNVNGEGLNKKPTGILTNCASIAKKLARRCDHRHFHVPVVNGLPKKAQVYPEEFCRAIVQGLQEECRKEKKLY